MHYHATVSLRFAGDGGETGKKYALFPYKVAELSVVCRGLAGEKNLWCG